MYGVQEDVDGGDHGVCWAGAGVPGGGAGRLQAQAPPHTRHRGGGTEVCIYYHLYFLSFVTQIII